MAVIHNHLLLFFVLLPKEVSPLHYLALNVIKQHSRCLLRLPELAGCDPAYALLGGLNPVIDVPEELADIRRLREYDLYVLALTLYLPFKWLYTYLLTQ